MARQFEQSREIAPTRMFMEVEGLTEREARDLAQEALAFSRANMPKFSGASARDLQPHFGEGFFGLRWSMPSIWYQEIGIRPYTMRSLAGKVIPMWIKDPTGVERKDNPKAKTQVGEDGVVRVLVFRRAAKQGARKIVMRGGRAVSVPQSYPGAPGRIAIREMAGTTRPGKVGGQIASHSTGGHASRHVGVRWRHPGLTARSFLHRGIVLAAVAAGIDTDTPIRVTDENWG